MIVPKSIPTLRFACPRGRRGRLLTAVLPLFLAACDTPEEPATTPEPEPAEVQADIGTPWPTTRGGPALQGRVHAAVPKQPEIVATVDVGAPILSEAAVAENTIVVGDVTGLVHAIDLESLESRWQFETADTIEGAPAIHDGRVFVGSGDGKFYALDLATGEKLWSIEGDEKFSSAANLIEIGGESRLLLNGYDGVTRCLDPADGSEIWNYPTEDFINGTPALIDGKYVAFGGCDSILHVLDATTGEKINEIITDAQITSSVATDGTRIFAGNHASQVVAADLNSEDLDWIYEGDEFPFFSAPAVDDARVYIGCRDKSLHAIDRETGEPAWTFPTGGRVESSPIAFDDAVVFGSNDGRLYAADPATGEEIWRLDLGEDLTAAPVYAFNQIIIGGGDGTLFVIK